MNRLIIASALALVLSAPAFADDAADCAAGIEDAKAMSGG